jgi:hypothetical protein
MGPVEPRSHPVATVVVLALAVLVGVVAIASVWANDQLLDTGGWASVSNRLLKSPEVRHRVAVFLGDEVVAQTEAQLDAAGEEATAERVMPPLRAGSTELAERVMATPRFRTIWRTANAAGHRALLAAVGDGGGRGDRAVVVDLTPALRQMADALNEEGLAREFGATDLAAQVEPGTGRIRVLEGEELHRARDAVGVVRHLTLPATIALLVLFLAAFLLGRRRLPRTFLFVGLALAATGGLALLLRAFAGQQIVDRLLGAGADRDAAEAAWRVITSKIADLAGLAIGIGAAAVLVAGALAVVRKAIAVEAR